MVKDIVVIELWKNINKFYRPNTISNNRSNYYKENLNYALDNKITVIDDIYHAIKGIIFYKTLKEEKSKSRFRNLHIPDIRYYWEEIFGSLPNNFPEYQVQLTSLWIYAYYHIPADDKEKYEIEPAVLYNLLSKLYEFSTKWLLPIERSNLYGYISSLDEFSSLSKKEKKSIYHSLGEIHDFLSTCNLISTIVPTISRRSSFVNTTGSKAKINPGKAFYVIITLPGIHIIRTFNEMNKYNPKEIYDRLFPLVKYYEELFKIAIKKIDDSLKTSNLAGVTLIDVTSYEDYLPPSIITSIDVPIRSFILRHEVASMVSWLVEAKKLKIDFGSFTKGLLRIT
jgi:hypothetical protein